MNEKLHQDMIQLAVKKGLGTLTSSQVFTATTGKYTGRATQQRFVASDPKTDSLVDWGEVNKKFPAEKTQRFLSALKARLHL
jgi:phosphoenolpyruvate carboxykinase (ATP)